MLRLFVKRVNHCVQVFDGLQTVVENFCRLILLKYYQTIASLIESPSNFFIKNHLWKFHEDLVNWQVDLTRNVVDLNLIVRLDNLF